MLINCSYLLLFTFWNPGPPQSPKRRLCFMCRGLLESFQTSISVEMFLHFSSLCIYYLLVLKFIPNYRQRISFWIQLYKWYGFSEMLKFKWQKLIEILTNFQFANQSLKSGNTLQNVRRNMYSFKKCCLVWHFLAMINVILTIHNENLLFDNKPYLPFQNISAKLKTKPYPN